MWGNNRHKAFGTRKKSWDGEVILNLSLKNKYFSKNITTNNKMIIKTEESHQPDLLTLNKMGDYPEEEIWIS